MSLSLLQGPQFIQPVYNPIYIVESSSLTNQYAFDFQFETIITGATTGLTYNQLLPTPSSNEVIFSPARILESYLSYDLVPNITSATESTNCVLYYNIIPSEQYVVFYNYSGNTQGGAGFTSYTLLTGITANPFITGDSIIVNQFYPYNPNINGVHIVLSANSTSIVIDCPYSAITSTGGTLVYSDYRKTTFTGTSITGYAWNASYQYAQIPSANYFNQFALTGNTYPSGSNWLTNQPSSVLATYSDRGTISFMNLIPNQPYGYSIDITVNYDDGSLAQYLFPISGTTSGDTNCYNIIYHCPAYPWNINVMSIAAGNGDIITSAVTSYSIQIVGNTISRFSGSSQIQTFIIDTSCSKYTPVRFMWLNRLGCFDYFDATLVSRKFLSINRDTYQKTLAYNYSSNLGNRGSTVVDVTAQEVYLATTNWVGQPTSNWLEELFTSNEVYILDNNTGYLTPIIIDDSSIEVKKTINDKLINYEFNYHKAVQLAIQRG